MGYRGGGGGRGVEGEVGGCGDHGRGFGVVRDGGGGGGWKLFSLRLGFLSCSFSSFLPSVSTFMRKTEGVLAAIVFFLSILLGVFPINSVR